MKYKVSYVFGERSTPTLIRELAEQPHIGDIVANHEGQFRVIEVVELMPKADEVYILAKVVPLNTP